MSSWPTREGVMTLGDDREAALEAGRELASSGLASSVIVHLAEAGQDRKFVSAIRAVGPARELAGRLGSAASYGIWQAQFRQVRDHGQTWPAGEESRGVGMVFGIWRKPGLSHSEFDAYWRDQHAPLALKHHVGMWAYVQCSFAKALSPHATDYDGVAICQFGSHEDMETRFYDGPEGERAIGRDVVQFGDADRLDRARMREIVLLREESA